MTEEINRIRNTKLKDAISLIGTLNEDSLKELKLFVDRLKDHIEEELEMFSLADESNTMLNYMHG